MFRKVFNKDFLALFLHKSNTSNHANLPEFITEKNSNQNVIKFYLHIINSKSCNMNR